MGFKAVLFFKDSNIGWSETYWCETSTSFDDMRSRLNHLIPMRMGILAQGPETLESGVPRYVGPDLAYVRLEDLDNPGSTSLYQVNPQQYEVEQYPGEAEVPWSAIYARVEGQGLGEIIRSTRIYSGVPQEIILDPPGPQNQTGWYKAWLNWVRYLVSGGDGWCVPNYVYTPIAGVVVVNVAQVSGQLSLTVTGTPSTTVPFTCYLRQFSPRQWNGVTTLANSSAFPSLWNSQGGKFYIPPKGPVRTGVLCERSVSLYPILNVFLRGECHRARGRVFGQPRGRRRSVPRS